MLALAALAAVALGCREDLGAAEAARRGGADGAALLSRPELLPGALAVCPCFVEAATTEIAEIPGGLSVTVKADRPGAVQEIRARSRLLARVAGGPDGAPEVCPVVAQRTTVLPQEVDGGVAILVFPEDAHQLDWVKQETNERLRGLVTLHAARGAGE